MRMVALQTHMRDVLMKPGDEFEVTEEEAHAYAARKNPLAGPLAGPLAAGEPPAQKKEPAAPKPKAPMAAVAKPARARPVSKKPVRKQGKPK